MAFNQWNRGANENLKFVETDDGNTAIRVVGSSGSTSLDVNTSSVDSSSVMGSSSANSSFTTAYASGTTITISSLPSHISALDTDDIVSIEQYASTGALTKKYTRDDATISVSGSTITVAGASFVASDTFVVYTNLSILKTDTSAIKTAVELIDDAVGTPDSAVPTKVIMIGGKAYATIPVEVADGDVVYPWFTLSGRQVGWASNLSSNSDDTTIVNWYQLNTLNVTHLNAITAGATGTPLDVTNFARKTVLVNCTYTSGTIGIKVYGNDVASTTGAILLDTMSFTATGTDHAIVNDHFNFMYLVADYTTGTGVGAITAKIIGRGQ